MAKRPSEYERRGRKLGAIDRNAPQYLRMHGISMDAAAVYYTVAIGPYSTTSVPCLPIVGVLGIAGTTRWATERVEAAVAELEARGAFQVDREVGMIYVPLIAACDPPVNQDQAIGWARVLAALPSSHLVGAAMAGMAAAMKREFVKGFEKAFRDASSRTGSCVETVCPEEAHGAPPVPLPLLSQPTPSPPEGGGALSSPARESGVVTNPEFKSPQEAFDWVLEQCRSGEVGARRLAGMDQRTREAVKAAGGTGQIRQARETEIYRHRTQFANAWRVRQTTAGLVRRRRAHRRQPGQLELLPELLEG